MTVIAAVEGGGTTFVVAIAELSDLSVIERAEFPTTTPEETLGACAAWLKDKEYAALGVAPHPPVDLDKASKSYGHITTTPKPGWQHTDVLAPLRPRRRPTRRSCSTPSSRRRSREWRRGPSHGRRRAAALVVRRSIVRWAPASASASSSTARPSTG